jgi:hypothetical protein
MMTMRTVYPFSSPLVYSECQIEVDSTTRLERNVMADKKTIFVAFAIEDERQRDFLKGHSLNAKCPIEFIDYSVKEAYTEDWKSKVRTRIRRSDGVIVLASANSLKSSGQKWEITCAAEEKKPVYSIWAYTDDRTSIPGVTTHLWTWDGITKFIDGL